MPPAGEETSAPTQLARDDGTLTLTNTDAPPDDDKTTMCETIGDYNQTAAKQQSPQRFGIADGTANKKEIKPREYKHGDKTRRYMLSPLAQQNVPLQMSKPERKERMQTLQRMAPIHQIVRKPNVINDAHRQMPSPTQRDRATADQRTLMPTSGPTPTTAAKHKG